MPIDQCAHTFSHLATEILPRHMSALREMIANPFDMSKFAIEGKGIRTLLEEFGREDDLSGCYVLMEGSTPLYVGISRGVIARLRQHVRGTSHFDASLAYRMAVAQSPHELTRSGAMA